MAQQMIGIGTVANDGTGDTLRVAGDKINDNFTELYAGLVGLLDFKGSQDCSANPNYPAASKGDFYLVSVAGKIGGASGISVEAGDTYFATADNAGGTQAGVGTSWTVIQGNVTAYISSLTGDVTTSGSGAAAATIANNAVTFAKMVAAASAGVVWASAAGNYSHNASGGGTTNFLRADGTWAAPPGSGGSFTGSSTTQVLTGTDTSTGVTPDALAALWEQGSDVASAGTVSLGEGGYFNITGTTTITDIDFATDKAGRHAWVKFAGALTLTHNASTLILPTGANITTAAGDTACFISEGSDVVRCVSYNRASGAALAGGSGGDLGAFHLQDQRAASTEGGTFTSGAWRPRVLNAVVSNSITSATHIAATVTITIASPGVVSWTAHGLVAGTPVIFTTTGALPTGLTAGTVYFVISPNTNDFTVSATSGGAAINTTGSQSGVHTGTSNQFELPAGTYEINASAPAFQVNDHQARLQNLTDASTALTGTSARSRATSTSDGTSVSSVRGRFTIAGTKRFELQHQCSTTLSSTGFGTATSGSWGTVVYAEVFIRRVS